MAIEPTRFVSRVSFNRGGTLLPLELYPSIKACSRLSAAPSPVPLTSAEMQVRGHSKSALRSIYGLTEAEFSMRFPDRDKQWKSAAGSWQFQGGEVVLEATITVFINNDYSVFDERDRIFDLIISHELEHVQDEIDNVEKHLPALVSSDGVVRRLLVDDGSGQPAKLPDREYRHWMVEKTKALGREWTHLEHQVLAIWAEKHNRLAESRDSGPDWELYRDNIDFLMNGMPKYVRWPARCR